MSRFSGKCDLADHVFGGEKNYFEAFDEFKQSTGGILHQHHRIKEVTAFNQDLIAELNPNFKIIEINKQISDRRFADGFRNEVSYEYDYYGQRYTAKQLKQKGGVYIDVEIHFDTVLDLIKYYPYVVSACCWSDGKAVVFISKESFVESEFDNSLGYGYLSMKDHYDKELAEHYREVCLALDANLDARQVVVPITSNQLKKTDDGDYIIPVKRPVDYNHPVKWSFKDGVISHWTSPKYLNDHEIVISKEDVEDYLKDHLGTGEVNVAYVEKYWPEDLI